MITACAACFRVGPLANDMVPLSVNSKRPKTDVAVA